MALSVLRLRRALSPLSATFIKHRFGSPSPVVCSISDHHLPQGSPSRRPHQFTPLLGFRSSVSLSDRRYDSGDSKISPDEILFEGCDYNHWLITMDFPDDPKPTPEQMVETYVQTLTKVVGSREEAMKRMYACSTTTYNGFQAVMTEEMSEKFRGLPGVVFILPDSYIDPVNKEYGGDKYEMGKITPRPPPVQYGRQGRYNDRNRNYDRPRYDRPRENVQMQGNRQFDYQGSYGQGDGRNYAPPQHNYAVSQHTHNPNVQGSLQGQGSADTPAPSHNPVGRQYNQPYSPQGAAGYNPMGQQGPQGAAEYNPAGQQANQLHGTQGAARYNPAGQQSDQLPGAQGAAGYNPAGQQANQPHGTQGAAGYNPAGHQFNQPYGPPSAAQGNPRSYAPPQNNVSRGISEFSPSTEGMNYGPNSGQYGSRHQNPVPPYQPPGGYVPGHEGGSSSGGSVAGGYHRQGPGYSYGQQNPGSEGYTGFNNAEKGQGHN